jgi:hypothetical protein
MTVSTLARHWLKFCADQNQKVKDVVSQICTGFFNLQSDCTPVMVQPCCKKGMANRLIYSLANTFQQNTFQQQFKKQIIN